MSRDIRPFRTGGSITCGPLEIEPVHVDHSIPGAYGFIIHASDATVVYSGDLRLHGSKPQLTREFVEAAAKAKPDVLLIEGTNVGEKKSQGSEDLVKKSLAAAAKGSDKLVLAGFDVKNADRLRSIHEIAQETGRRFVIPLKRAQLYEALANDPQLGLPALASGDPAIYLPRRNFVHPDGTYPIEDFGEDEQELMGRSGVATVTSRDVKAKESEFLMVLDYYEFNELLDLKPTAGSKYLFSKTEPFNEEMEIDFDRTKAWLDKFAFDVRTSHCSGHASRDDLFGIVKDIGAKKVIPIHTEHPAMFSGFPKMTAILGSSIEVKA